MPHFQSNIFIKTALKSQICTIFTLKKKKNIRRLGASPPDPQNSHFPLRVSGYTPDWRAQVKLLDVLSNDIMRKAKKRKKFLAIRDRLIC